jgi:hypothetical protein
MQPREISLEEMQQLLVEQQRQLAIQAQQLSILVGKETGRDSEGTAWFTPKQARDLGNYDIPEQLASIFKRDSFECRADKSCVAEFMAKFPEPRGGYLKPQTMDLNLFDEVKQGEDKVLMDLQRSVLASVKPWLAVFDVIESNHVSSDEKLRLIKEGILPEAIRYGLHVGADIRVTRRIQAAKRADCVPKSEVYHTVGSSRDELLFGPEVVDAITKEKARAPLIKPKNDSHRKVPRSSKRAPKSSSAKPNQVQ